MARFPMMQVDAFTTTPLAGNACAVVFEADALSPATMLAIAREMNLSETAFVRRSAAADFGVRFYTPAEEIPLAGHPTIATVFALADSGRLPLQGEVTPLTLELSIGTIQVEVLAQNGTAQRITMTQFAPKFMSTHNPGEVLPCFGLTVDDLLSGVPIQTVSTGTPQLMVPLRDLDALRRVRVDHVAYQSLRERSDFFSPHLFCLQGVTPAGQTFARHFGTPPDLAEDPFTGSATGGMAAYLWHYGLLDGPTFVAEQGHWLSRPGEAHVEVVGPRDAIQAVRVGGAAVAVLYGELVLPDSEGK